MYFTESVVRPVVEFNPEQWLYNGVPFNDGRNHVSSYGTLQ